MLTNLVNGVGISDLGGERGAMARVCKNDVSEDACTGTDGAYLEVVDDALERNVSRQTLVEGGSF